ncbi:MAG TPA: FYVE zinc finger domain-containing protein [Geminicoccaceae bacterium]|nr:FYVE zinc finger domain-containing protein [Geminicoccus sp.]HMU49047.1 FYVE zinc finger domain-containing protein [Geminicoccaceae bacterium]
MATLSTHTRRKLRFLPNGGYAPQNPGALACWNWALTGFGPNPVNPDTAFSFVAGFIGQGDLDPAFQVPARLHRLQQLQADWAPFAGARAVSGPATAAFATVTDGIVKLAIEANGLSWSAGVTPYQLCMYYDDGLDRSGELRAPNYTHWWLKIDGGGAPGHNDGIEAFPGSTVITIRRPEYSVNHVYRIHLAGLHPDHVQRIDATLQHVVRGAHNPYGPGHGGWAPDNSRNSCSICGDAFTLFHRRHHCRCCGQLVCADCSPNTRPGVARVHHPNNNDGNGPQRVCLYCE